MDPTGTRPGLRPGPRPGPPWLYSESGTFELSHHVGEVVLQLVVGGELQAHVVLGDPREALRGVDAPLVQDAVDAEGCGGQPISVIRRSEIEPGSLRSGPRVVVFMMKQKRKVEDLILVPRSRNARWLTYPLRPCVPSLRPPQLPDARAVIGPLTQTRPIKGSRLRLPLWLYGGPITALAVDARRIRKEVKGCL